MPFGWGKKKVKEDLKSDIQRQELKQLGTYIPQDHRLEERIKVQEALKELEEPIEYYVNESKKTVSRNPEAMLDEQLRRLGILNSVMEQAAIPYLRAKDNRSAMIVMMNWRLLVARGIEDLTKTKESLTSEETPRDIANEIFGKVESLEKRKFTDPALEKDIKTFLKNFKDDFQPDEIAPQTMQDKTDLAKKAINTIIEEIEPYGMMIKDASFGDSDVAEKTIIVIQSVTPPQQQFRQEGFADEFETVGRSKPTSEPIPKES